jgi:hypothetical protein
MTHSLIGGLVLLSIIQIRYELPIKGAFFAWSLGAFVAAVGLLRRKKWARLLSIGLMASA